MKDMNMIDSCQAHLPVQYTLNIKFNSFLRSDTGVVIDSELHLIRRANQASCLLHWMSVFTLAVPHLLFPLQQNQYYDNILKTKLLCLPSYK